MKHLATRKMAWQLGLCVVLLVSFAAQGSAQICRKEKVNQQGTAGADIVVGASPVTIALRNTSRCALYIGNSGSESMRCRDVTNDGVPSATAGLAIGAGQSATITETSQGLWQCIQDSGATTANVSESLP